MQKWISVASSIVLLAVAGCAPAERAPQAGPGASNIMDTVESLYADSDGVRIHYAAAGEGPLVLFIHGFPDFWYSWRHQMLGLSDEFRVAAMDLRGYNLSDQPPAQADYGMELLLRDVAAVIQAEGRDRAIIVGHDWGGAIAWQSAFNLPQMVEKLIIVNLPHPRGLFRELANNPEQQANAEYARQFQQPDSHLALSAEGLAEMPSGGDPESFERYREAFERSSLEAMMFYYRQNYPRPPYQEAPQTPVIDVPVLQFHGLEDPFLLHHGLNNTWEWLGADYTLVTIPGAGHWSHHDEPDLVTDTMKWWLLARR